MKQLSPLYHIKKLKLFNTDTNNTQTPLHSPEAATKLQRYFKEKNIQLDPQQQQACQSLQQLYQLITQKKNPTPYCGLYLWGGVGTGKTLLMDALYNITEQPKIRLHHHELFKQLMHQMHNYKNSKHPLQASIQAFIDCYKLTCFDDLHLNDIADAKLWQGIFEQARDNNVFMLITSNTHPAKLMDTPGYHEKIKPLLNMMQKHLLITQLDAGIDYRTQTLKSALANHSACLPKKQLPTLYYELTQTAYIACNHRTITIQNRTINCHSHTLQTIFFTLSQLCQTIRSYADYIEICEKFTCIVIIEFDTQALNNPLVIRRFIWLIDIIYDKNTHFFVLSDEDIIKQLHSQAHPDIKRTISRLKQLF